MKYIRIKGASQHNLKNVSIDIPRDSLVVITGVSGSGKSTLAFDTIYAEGQRRYVESLSTYARQFIGQMDKPEVESIEGLSPAIAIEQRSASHNPRSTVGTVTEIYDYLRLLYARIGSPHCFQCGREIRSQTIDTMVEQLLALPGSTAVSLMAPVVRGKKGEFQRELGRLRREGYVRVKVDGEIRDLADEIALDKNKRHDIDVVVDRLVIREGIRKRLRDSLEITARLSDGLVKADIAGGEQILFSERYACPDCNVSLPELAPRMFSFNSPYGACPECDGLGTKIFFDEDLIVSDPGLSIREGAIAPWQNRDSMYFHQMLEALSEHFGFDINTPFKELPEKIRRMLLYGSGDEAVRFYTNNGGKRTFTEKPFEGIIPNLDRRYHETDSYDMRTELERYLNMSECPACRGARLKKESLSVTVGGKNIYEFCRLSIADSMDFLKGLTLTRQEAAISERILKEIRDRLRFLLDVGMDYLSLERASGTLSGGEWQRIRLATQIGSGLSGVLYVLDEPTIGLHPRDNGRLIATLARLKEMGNTVLVVEHDADMMMASDGIIDMGPGAGLEGGHVVFQGTPSEILASETSLTGRYLSGRLGIPVPQKRRAPAGRFIVLEGATENNLKDIDIRIPVGVLTCVTGVSGSGKSTLVLETLYRVLARRLYRYKGRVGKIRNVRDLGGIERVIVMNQQPIGRTPRSNPITYTGALHLHPGPFRPAAGIAHAGLQAGAVQLQRQGRALRVLRGQRPHQDRDALPARCLRDLRHLPRKALQPRHPGDPVQGQEHRRGSRHDGERGPRLLREHPVDPHEAAAPARRGAGLHPARPVGHDALRRRGPADQACPRTRQTLPGRHPLHPRRAHNRPSFRRRAEAARRAHAPRQHGQLHRRDRAQSRRDQVGRLDHRPRSRGRARRRQDRGPGHAGGRGTDGGVADGKVPEESSAVGRTFSG